MILNRYERTVARNGLCGEDTGGQDAQSDGTRAHRGDRDQRVAPAVRSRHRNRQQPRARRSQLQQGLPARDG